MGVAAQVLSTASVTGGDNLIWCHRVSFYTSSIGNIFLYNSQWIKDLSIRIKNIKLLEENVEENFYSVGLGSDLLDMTPKTQATKIKMDTLDYIKMKKLLGIRGH